MSSHEGCQPHLADDDLDDRLADAASGGDREALEQLTLRCTPLVRRIAAHHHSPGWSDDLEDLVQVGMVALLEAVSRFEPARGSFRAFAAVTIAGSIKRHFRDRGWRFHVPRSLHDAALAIDRAAPSMRAQLGREPTTAELAAQTGLEASCVREARAMQRAAVSVPLHGGDDDEDHPSLTESLGREEPGFGRAELRAVIAKLDRGLDDRERTLLALRFGLDFTQDEIAGRIGISQMHVSRLLNRALAGMREELEGSAAG